MALWLVVVAMAGWAVLSLKPGEGGESGESGFSASVVAVAVEQRTGPPDVVAAAEPRESHRARRVDPDPDHRGPMRLLHVWGHQTSRAPWWVQAGVISKIVLVFPTAGVLACAWLVTVHQMDSLVAFVGILIGLLYQTMLLLVIAWVLGQRIYHIPWLGKRLARVSAADWQRRMSTRPAREGWATTFLPRQRAASSLGSVLYAPSFSATGRFLVTRLPALVVWSLVTYGLALLAYLGLYRWLSHVALVPFVVASLLISTVVRTVPMLLIRRGRQRLIADLERLAHHEYWPLWALYAPLVPYLAWLIVKHRGVTVFTCCNPGIENGGGVIGESKAGIMQRLAGPDVVLPTLLIQADEQVEVRAASVAAAMRSAGFSYPVILKPDAGQRGFGVSLVHNEAGAREYLGQMRSAAVLQPYAVGPCECGILWARHREPSSDGSAGFIFSVTRKEFAIIVGDGVRTVEELILRHPRHRRWADLFLSRLPDRAMDVLRAGEELRLGVAGNHCQGAMFRDGADLLTPELARVIDGLARSFEGGLDFGRFDVRYESDERLRRGESLQIVELNGTMSESTNIFDPDRSAVWAYSVLFAQWRVLFELGAVRRAQGGTPLGLVAIAKLVVGHYRRRTGSAVSS